MSKHLFLRSHTISGTHIGMGIQPSSSSVNLATDSHNPNLVDDVPPKPHHHHHHVGETQHIGLDSGHLIRGPHGSLAFAPDTKVEEKLSIDADMVKPNHEGVVVSYENHPKNVKILD